MRTRVIILAAGRGTRMNPVRSQSSEATIAPTPPGRISHGANPDLPKVLIPFEGKPMIRHLLDAVAKSGIDARPVIVTGYQAEIVERTLGDENDYVRQEEQLGTGHAVQCAEKLLAGNADQVIVLYGDHPFVKASTIISLRALHERERCPLSMMTVRVEDFNDWRAPFADFSRIIRDASGRIVADVQVKDATPAELAIREVSPAFFCFDAEWLWPHLKKITDDNAAREYYLTDLVKIAMDESECVASLPMEASEAIGINTPDHLETAKTLAQ